MKKLSMEEANEREQLVFKRNYDPQVYSRMGGLQRFDNMTVETARKLIDLGYLDPDDCQNSSPTNGEFVEFIEGCKNPGDWYLHGYAISAERSDCRVNIEGISTYCEVDQEDMVNFLMQNRFADELQAGINQSLYCWYD